jgi:cellulose synthase/poly-beta-1,6-N-acetylglucosamine synthase-like glycosyltransferase
MTGLSLILQCLLAGVLCVIAVLSVQLVVLGYLRLYRAAPRVRTPLLPDEALPRVLVQLPVCDEGPLAVRVAAAAARLDWPRDKLEIQVLDDGRAGDPEDLVRAILSVVPDGVNLDILRRGERSGFKAGNLAYGRGVSELIGCKAHAAHPQRRPEIGSRIARSGRPVSPSATYSFEILPPIR